MGDVLDWQEWQDALADALRAGPGRSVFIYVDDQELTDLAGADAVTDLSSVVVSAFTPSGDPYARIHRRALASWNEQNEEPPSTLPLLALTVLAATRMETSAGTLASAFYKRMWELTSAAPDSVLAGRMRHYFPTVAEMWLELHRWLGAGGQDFGVSTIRLVDSHTTRIGYPLSQALLRRTDRHALTQFWAIVGLHSLQSINKEDLLAALRLWMRTDRGLSRRFVDMVGHLSAETAPFFAEVLLEAAQRWDGEERSRTGLRLRPARLVVQQAMNGGWHANWRVDTPEGEATVPLRNRDLTDAPIIYAAGGLVWSGVRSGVLALRWDTFEGCWMSADRFLAGVPQALVWHVSKHEAVKDFVSRSDESLNLKLRPLIPGTAFFVQGVRFSAGARLDDALAAVGLTGGRLSGAVSPRLALRDGLRVSKSLHHAVYIHGGEPDIAIPQGQSTTLAVSLDGSRHEFRRGVTVPLRPMELGPGEHRAGSEDGSVVFQTIVAGHVVVSPGPRLPLALIPTSGAESARERTDPRACFVTGALAHGHRDRFGIRLLVARRRCDQTWLVGPFGQIRRVEEPPIPAYWSQLLAEVSPLHFLVKRHQSEGWLVQRRGDEYLVDEVVAVPPTHLPTASAVIDPVEWRDVLSRAARACTTDGWLALIRAAGVEA